MHTYVWWLEVLHNRINLFSTTNFHLVYSNMFFLSYLPELNLRPSNYIPLPITLLMLFRYLAMVLHHLQTARPLPFCLPLIFH